MILDTKLTNSRSRLLEEVFMNLFTYSKLELSLRLLFVYLPLFHVKKNWESQLTSRIGRVIRNVKFPYMIRCCWTILIHMKKVTKNGSCCTLTVIQSLKVNTSSHWTSKVGNPKSGLSFRLKNTYLSWNSHFLMQKSKGIKLQNVDVNCVWIDNLVYSSATSWPDREPYCCLWRGCPHPFLFLVVFHFSIIFIIGFVVIIIEFDLFHCYFVHLAVVCWNWSSRCVHVLCIVIFQL